MSSSPLVSAAAMLGLNLSPAEQDAFARYRQELMTWNQRFNLTAITEPHEIDNRHFLDSLTCLAALPQLDGRPLAAWLADAPALIDIGTGAGFPGLPLKIVWPQLRLTLLEATGKKCRFLQHMVDSLGLESVQVVQGRAESYGQGEGRERFDLAVARAVAALPVLLEYSLPHLRVGGWFIAQKGRIPVDELQAASAALHILGGRLHKVMPVAVPGVEGDRTLVLVQKIGPTPARYPRRPGVPARKPLP